MRTTTRRGTTVTRSTRRTASRLGPRAAAAALALLVLAGCQTGQEPADEPSTGTPTPTATAEPTPTTEPAPSTAPDAGAATNGPNTITSPVAGDTLAGPQVTATGEGTAFEATLNYQVVDAVSGDVVAGPDYTMAGANGEVGPWAIDLTLEPGEYTLQVWEPDMSDGEGGEGAEGTDALGNNPVEVTFTVE